MSFNSYFLSSRYLLLHVHVFVIQVSMKMALRRKFRQCRQSLCSSQAVAEARAKFGRPGVAGRKRKSDAEGPPTVTTLIKKERLKLKVTKLITGQWNMLPDG